MIEIIPNWHPIFVHFTVALLSISSVLFVISALLPESQWKANSLTVAKWNLWLGTFLTIGTLLAGWQAYNTVIHDAPSHAAMTDHRNWALVTATIFTILTVLSIKYNLQNSRSFILSIVIATMLLLTTAYKGGESVYRYGLGVMSLPQSNTPHGHGDANSHTDSTNDHDSDTPKNSSDHGESNHAH